MPCDRVVYNTVELNLADRKKLIAALRAEGIEVQDYNDMIRIYDPQSGISGGITKGEVSIDAYGREATDFVNRIKRSYSREVIKASAKRFKWNLKVVGENRFVAQKRF